MNICALMEVVLLASLAHVLARRARLTLDIATHCERQCLLLDDSQRRQHADSAPMYSVDHEALCKEGRNADL